MPRTLAIHSFRRGTGKSNLAANVGVLLAGAGRRVALVDMDFSGPVQPILFGVPETDIAFTLNDFLWGNCEIEQAALPLTPYLDGASAWAGALFLLPASPRLSDIARVLRGDYYLHLLNDAFDRLSQSLGLDLLLIDTHAGLGEETLLAFGMSDAMSIILSNDPRDFQGTAVTVDILRELEVPRITLVVNQVPETFEVDQVRRRVAEVYGCEVIGVLPHSTDLAALAGRGIFVLQHPDHPLTHMLRQIADRLAARD